MNSKNNWYKIISFCCKNLLDLLPKQYKHKNGENDRDTLIEQSLTLIEQSTSSP